MFQMDIHGTKWDIFLAALDLFARDGYHHVSVSQIADASGIRASSIYNHYDCKDSLLETMFRYYDYYAANFMPPLDSLFEHMKTHPPKETLRKAMHYMDPRAQSIMSQIFAVAASLHSDPRATALVQKYTFQMPRVYLTSLLHKMIDEQRIEEINVDTFVFIYCSLWHSVNMRYTGPYPADPAQWQRAVERMLDEIVELVPVRGQ